MVKTRYVPPTYEDVLLEMGDAVYQGTPTIEEMIMEEEMVYIPENTEEQTAISKLRHLAGFAANNHNTGGRLTTNAFPELFKIMKILKHHRFMEVLNEEYGAEYKVFEKSLTGFYIKLKDKNKNNMEELVLSVKEFAQTAGQPSPESITELDIDRSKFRLGLINEEFEELMLAAEEENATEERDAVIDLIYVAIGYAVERGFADRLPEDFRRVHRNNMSKFCTSEQEAKDTVAKYDRQSVHCYYKQNPDNKLWVVFRTSDNKVMKSIRWQQVNLNQKNQWKEKANGV